jgi:hypothetical protein
LIHFENYEISEAAFAKTPGRTKPGDSAANDHNRDFFNALGRGESGAIAEQMTYLEGIVNERAFDPFFTFEGETNKRRAAETKKLAAAQLQ